MHERRPSLATKSTQVQRQLLTTTRTNPFRRANPFPKVTDLICRLPLPTLFYRLEAAHLGDLLRIWVRTSTKFVAALNFSRVTHNARDNTTRVLLYGNQLPYLRPNRFHGSTFLN